jgi:hypothetical protein
VIASTFGPRDSYDTGAAWLVSTALAPTAGAYQAWAESFTTLFAAPLASFRVAQRVVDATDPLRVDLLVGESLDVATLLESFASTREGIVDYASLLHPVLLPGETYWITLSVAPTERGHYGWWWNDQHVSGEQHFQGDPNDQWLIAAAERGAFDVTVGPAVTSPEPATLALLATGLLALGAAQRERTRGRPTR